MLLHCTYEQKTIDTTILKEKKKKKQKQKQTNKQKTKHLFPQ